MSKKRPTLPASASAAQAANKGAKSATTPELSTKRGKGRPSKYPTTLINQARKDYLLGDSSAEIAARLGCSARSVRAWVKQSGWDDQLRRSRETLEGLDKQIHHLSTKRSLTDNQSKRLAMLTRSRERVARGEPKPPAIIKRQIAADIAKAVFGPEFGLYSYQIEFIRDNSRYRIILKARQIGFSFILALDALLGALAGRNQLIVSASQEQSDILIEYIIQHAAKLGITLDATAKSEITIGSCVIRALPANQRTIQGFNGDVYLDEFGWQQRDRLIWRAVLPSITAVGGRVTICSTPFIPGNLFWEIATNHKERWSHFQRTTITLENALEQGMNLPGGIEELRQNFDSESWAMMYECKWAEDGSALLTWELLESIAKAETQRLSWDKPIYVGVDVGRVNDKTAIVACGRTGFNSSGQPTYQLLFRNEYQRKPFDEQEALIHQLYSQYQVRRLQIDSTGIGRNLAENICNAHPAVSSAHHFTQGSKERMALNLLKLCEEKRLAIPKDPELFAQLHAVKRSVSGNSIKYDAARDQHGHADTFWALALALDNLAYGDSGGWVWNMFGNPSGDLYSAWRHRR